MTILEFEEAYNEETEKYLDLGSSLCYIRTVIYNTHEYIKSEKLREARLDILISFDKVYGTPLDDRQY